MDVVGVYVNTLYTPTSTKYLVTSSIAHYALSASLRLNMLETNGDSGRHEVIIFDAIYLEN